MSLNESHDLLSQLKGRVNDLSIGQIEHRQSLVSIVNAPNALKNMGV